MLCVKTVYSDRGTMGNADICMTYGVYFISWYEAAHAVYSIPEHASSTAKMATSTSSINTVLIACKNTSIQEPTVSLTTITDEQIFPRRQTPDCEKGLWAEEKKVHFRS